jgi:hypothetical protein
MTTSYVVCVNNEGYPASLEVRKIYEAVVDAADDQPELIRVIDESGEDYLFPANKFVMIELPAEARVAFQRES